MSVIIPACNSRNTLSTCLQTLAQQAYPRNAFEVIVVGDTDTVGFREQFNGLELPSSFQYLSTEHTGPVAAKNAGIKSSSGEYLFFLDGNVIPSLELIQAHVSAHLEQPATFVQGKVIPAEEASVFDVIKAAGLNASLWGTRTPVEYFCIAWNLSVKKKYVEQVGGFDKSFECHGFEDLEFGFRLSNEKGITRRYRPGAVGRHCRATDVWDALRKSYESGKSFVHFARLHPDALQTNRWPRSKATFTSLLSLAAMFRPYTLYFARLRSIQLAQFERILSRKSNRDLQETLLPLHRELASYCFFEGAHTALKNFPQRIPLLLGSDGSSNEVLAGVLL